MIKLNGLTSLAGKPIAALSNILNTPSSGGRNRPFYWRNLIDTMQGRTLHDAVDGKIVLVTGGSSGIGEAAAKEIARAGGEVILVARTRVKLEKVADSIRAAGEQSSIPVDRDLLCGLLGSGGVVGPFDEFAVLELRAGADERHEMGRVDRPPA
jgi:hypothetical protein